MKKRIKKRELILFSLWIIIVSAIFADMAIRNAYLKFSRLEEEISLNEDKLLRLKAILRQSKDVNSGYEQVISKYKTIIDSDNLLQEIEKIANTANVNILNIKPSAARDEGLFKTFSLKIEIQDEIASVARFIHSLSDELKSVGLERLQISSSSREELPRATLVINAVVFKE